MPVTVDWRHVCVCCTCAFTLCATAVAFTVAVMVSIMLRNE